MQSITLIYLYRDSSNYKNFGSIAFSNLTNIPIVEIENVLLSDLIDGAYFVAEDWGLPTLYFEEWTEDDHNWHEFISIKASENASTDRNIDELLNRIISKQKTGP